jgi:uncharacterized protein YkwD
MIATIFRGHADKRRIYCRNAEHAREHRKTTTHRSDLTSNHVMVNKLRDEYYVPALERSRSLDDLARAHANYMAKTQRLVHVVEDGECLQELLGSDIVGENIQRGTSVLNMHLSTIQVGSIHMRNLVSRQFKQFGMGTALGDDGKLYMCQVFRR